TDQKRRAFAALAAATRDFLMIYEPTLADGEDRQSYLQRYRRINRSAWAFLTPEQWVGIDRHVTGRDRPETAATWLELGRAAGFDRAREVFCDPTGFYRLYRYDRS